MYFCATCQEPVDVVGETITRRCAHTDAAVVMSLAVHLRGSSSMEGDERSLMTQAKQLWERIGQFLNIGNKAACAECGAPARVKEGGIVRACGHKTAGILRG